MGYTHYWYREQSIDREKFAAIGTDFNRIILALDDAGVHLGNGGGVDVPVVTAEIIAFNGLVNCGHPKNAEIVIPWPSKAAAGIGSNRTAVDGGWFAGVTLQKRACDGDCSYESVWFEREIKPQKWQEPENGLYFECCKTAFRPYDLAVTAFLIITKHHLGNRFVVSTDGEQPQWNDARVLCYGHLGYGMEYVLDAEGKLNKRAV